MSGGCEHHRERFSEYLDGELNPAEREALEAHLADCAECRAELALWRKAVESVAGLPRRRAPRGFASRVSGGLVGAEGRTSARPRVAPMWRRAMPIAAMLLLTVGLAFTVRENVLLRRRLEAPPQPAAFRDQLTVAGQPGAVEEAIGRARLEGADLRRPAAEALPAAAGRIQGTELSASSAELETKLDEATGRVDADMVARYDYPAALADRLRSKAPEQILTVRAIDTARVMYRAVSEANSLRVEGELTFAPDGTVNIYLRVPPDRYEMLLQNLAVLTPPTSQSLSNTGAAKGSFFGVAAGRYAQFQNERFVALNQQLAATEPRGRDELPEQAQAAGMAEAGALLGQAAPAAPPAGPRAGPASAAGVAGEREAGEPPAWMLQSMLRAGETVDKPSGPVTLQIAILPESRPAEP